MDGDDINRGGKSIMDGDDSNRDGDGDRITEVGITFNPNEASRSRRAPLDRVIEDELSDEIELRGLLNKSEGSNTNHANDNSMDERGDREREKYYARKKGLAL